MWNKWTARRIGAQKILPLIWQYGGPRQRFFLLFSLASAGLAIFLTALVVWMVLKSAWPDEVGWTYTLPLLGFILLNQSIQVPLQSDGVLREGLRRGWLAEARVLMEQGRLERALRRLDRVAAQDERYPGLWDLAAEAYERLGELEVAAECRRRAKEGSR